MMPGMSTYVRVVTSPATCTWPVVIMVSTATRLPGSSLIMASRMASLIWSAILSGWPSVTDSEVKRRRATFGSPLACGDCGEFILDCGEFSPDLRIGQPRGDQVPHHVSQGLLGPARDRRDGAVGAVDDGLVVRRAEPEPVPDRIDDEQVTTLPGQLGPGLFRGGVGLGGEPDQDLGYGRLRHEPGPFGIMGRTGGLARLPGRGQPGQDVRVLGEPQRLRRLAVLLDLGRAARRRTVV